jgi:hypothetical protein
VRGVIGGEVKCLHEGEFCSLDNRADYRRYGFRCSGDPPRLASVTPASTPAPASRRVTLNTGCRRQVHPRLVFLACATGELFVDGMYWQDWGSPVAHSLATLRVKGCDPSCAEDPRSYFFFARVKVDRLTSCPSGRRAYRRISVRIVRGAPRLLRRLGVHRSFSLGLIC